MRTEYHRQILFDALHDLVGRKALEEIETANIGQDALPNQIGHDEYHFDNNAFLKGRLYIWQQMRSIRPALRRGQEAAAWHAFGRLSHAVQDLYAHSNYVTLWLASFKSRHLPPAELIQPADQRILAHPKLRSGKLYYPLEIFSFIPGLRRLVLPFLPADSHAHMNLDGPERGPLFAYAMQAATRHTRQVFLRILSWLDNEQRRRFTQNRV